MLLVVLAWVACNGRWADAEALPLPAELAIAPVTLVPERNAFVALQGLTAPAGGDIVAAGLAALQPQAETGQAGRLGWPQVPALQCQPGRDDCGQRWRSRAEALQAFLADSRLLGERCERIVQAEGYEEVWPARPDDGPRAQASFASLPFPRFGALTECTRWFGMQAAMALHASRPDDALAQLRQADRLARLALAGSRSLMGNMVAISAVQLNWVLAVQLGLSPGARAELLAPLPQPALSPRAWVPHEAAFARGVFHDMVDNRRGCQAAVDEVGKPVASWWERQLCRMALGLMPEQTAQDVDAGWQARLAVVPASGPAGCEALQAAPWVVEPAGLVWRNTLARMLLAVPDGAHWSRYAARQVDLELLRQTLRAQALGEPMPAIVQLTREDGGQRFAACRARLVPADAEATLRLPQL